MQAWGGIAVVQLALLALALRRVRQARLATVDAPARTLWWPGVLALVAAVLAAIVMVGDGGGWAALALFATAVLGADTVLMRGALVASLCTRPAADVPGVPRAADEPGAPRA